MTEKADADGAESKMTTTTTIDSTPSPSVNYSQTVSFLASTPPAVTRLLTTLAPVIFFLSYLLDCVTWNGGRHSGPGGGPGRGGGPSSWLVVLIWWLICGIGPEVWAYGINGVVLAMMGVAYLRRNRTRHIEEKIGKEEMMKKRAGGKEMLTSQALLDATVTHLDHLSRLTSLLISEIIQPLFYSISWENQKITLTLFRLSLTMWPVIILGAWYVPYSTRAVVGTTGTLVLVWTAPWFRILRRVLWRSATIRFLVRSLLFVLNGFHPVRGIPPRAPFSLAQIWGRKGPSTLSGQRAKGTDESVLIFQFIIYENQRWWVGLDWTAALLPQERPPWADEHNNPISPPASFALPSPTKSIFAADSPQSTPSHTKAAPGKTFAIERRVEWEWIDPEWHVVKSAFEIESFGDGPSQARPKPKKPQVREDDIEESEEEDEDDQGKLLSSGGAGPASDFAEVDENGWVYSNNTWTAASSRPGFRKYTRRRRWTRRARALEVESLVQVDQAEIGVAHQR